MKMKLVNVPAHPLIGELIDLTLYSESKLAVAIDAATVAIDAATSKKNVTATMSAKAVAKQDKPKGLGLIVSVEIKVGRDRSQIYLITYLNSEREHGEAFVCDDNLV